MANGRIFATNVARLIAKYQDRQEAIARQTVQEIADRIIGRTPVDTGFARASWWSAIDRGNGHPNPPQPVPSGQKVVGAEAVNPLHVATCPGHIFGLYNAAAYIRRLEYGHSKQAPAGMVRLTQREAPQIVADVAAMLGVG